MISALVLAAAIQGNAPKAPKLPPKLPKGLLLRSIAWLPPFAPQISEPERTKWRDGVLSALNKPKPTGVYRTIPSATVLKEMKKEGLDPLTQGSTWSSEAMWSVGKAVKARYVGILDLFPITPNVDVKKDQVMVTGHVLVYEVATKKAVNQETFNLTGPQPTAGKGSTSDGYPVAVDLAERVIPMNLRFRFEKYEAGAPGL